jgi:hypothetical protein
MPGKFNLPRLLGRGAPSAAAAAALSTTTTTTTTAGSRSSRLTGGGRSSVALQPGCARGSVRSGRWGAAGHSPRAVEWVGRRVGRSTAVAVGSMLTPQSTQSRRPMFPVVLTAAAAVVSSPVAAPAPSPLPPPVTFALRPTCPASSPPTSASRRDDPSPFAPRVKRTGPPGRRARASARLTPTARPRQISRPHHPISSHRG